MSLSIERDDDNSFVYLVVSAQDQDGLWIGEGSVLKIVDMMVSALE